MAEVIPSHRYTIYGVPVTFPIKAYPSQIAMMDRVMKGLERGQHALLESPTGTGKSLALLCSTLAWQEQQHLKQRELKDAEDRMEDDMKVPDSPVKKKHIPKIFFGTRTHKQVSQIVHELGRTSYRNVPMTILASREHTCIEPEVSKSTQRNENCKLLREGSGCGFQDNVKRKISQEKIQSMGLESAWDLEDFVKLGVNMKACPYYGTRELMSGAAIIFCPYNYLVDPVIRKSMDISLKNQIVVLDEAHNIEDSSRDAASKSVTLKQLREAAEDLAQLVMRNFWPVQHEALCQICRNLMEMIELNESRLHDDFASVTWEGSDMLAVLSHAGLTPATLQTCSQYLDDVTPTEVKHNRNKNKEHSIKAATGVVLESIFYSVGFIFQEDGVFMPDYRLSITRSVNFKSDSQWFSKKKKNRRDLTYTLNFWCLNPAVAFSCLARHAHSIILTSGTLSPMSSFESELGASFPIKFEASHIIPKDQVWVGSISHGPKGNSLLGTYANTETLAYQDEIGRLVCCVCETIPHGILCFFPSYKLLDKLKHRWEQTGQLDEIGTFKSVLWEPKSSGNFEDAIREFYLHIQDSQMDNEGGAIFFAVFRGKVSEGIDFSDNNARAVIAVSIPYPNVKDILVSMKRKYNDNFQSRGLLSGNLWYEIQGYRALNQGLGRCIRHINDWGALILVDDRYGKNPEKYTSGLSKWIRNQVAMFSSCRQALCALQKFSSNRILKHKENESKCLFSKSVSCQSQRADVAILSDVGTSNIIELVNMTVDGDVDNDCKIIEVSAPSSVNQASKMPFKTSFTSTQENTDENIMTVKPEFNDFFSINRKHGQGHGRESTRRPLFSAKPMSMSQRKPHSDDDSDDGGDFVIGKPERLSRKRSFQITAKSRRFDGSADQVDTGIDKVECIKCSCIQKVTSSAVLPDYLSAMVGRNEVKCYNVVHVSSDMKLASHGYLDAHYVEKYKCSLKLYACRCGLAKKNDLQMVTEVISSSDNVPPVGELYLIAC